MANKLYAMEQLTEEVAKDVAANPQEWMRFLDTASRLYRYTFPEQLLIYAQRPEATAVAAMEIWNQKMYRWIKKGSKGIALIDNTSGPKTKLRYVFDVGDTYKVKNLGKDPQLWNLPMEGEELVAGYLQEQFNLEETEGGLAEVLRQAAVESVQDWLPDAFDELYLDVGGTFLEELDVQNQRVEFRELMINSTWYLLLNRCGMDVQEYLEVDDFRYITDFNQLKVMGHLGSSVNELAKPVLMQIGRYVMTNLEKDLKTLAKEKEVPYNEFNTLIRESKTKDTEDREENKEEQEHERDHLQSERRVSDPGYQPGGDSRDNREIRTDEGKIPERTRQIDISDPSDERLRGTSDRDPEAGRREDGRTDARADEGGRGNGGTESSRPDEMGRTGEQLQTAGGGNSETGDYIQLSLFPQNEQEQADYGTAAGDTPAAVFAFPETYIDEALRTGGNDDHSLEYVLLDLMQKKPGELLRKDLKEAWKGGKGLFMPDGVKVSVWYSEEGISFHRGNSARRNPEKILSWDEAAERIETLYKKGKFTTNTLAGQAIDGVRKETASLLCFFYREEMKQSRWGVVYSEAVEKIAGELKEPENIKNIYQEILPYGTDVNLKTQWQQKRYKNITDKLQKLENASAIIPQEGEEPQQTAFITEDEIDRLLQEGGIVQGGKRRILSFYQQEPMPDKKAAIAFLKEEYGIGGHSHSISGSSRSDEWHDAKGFHLKKGKAEKKLTWKEAEKRIRILIENKEYPYVKDKEMQERSVKEDHTKEKENVLNFSTEDTLQFQIDYSEHDRLSVYDKEKDDFTVRKMSFAVANKLFTVLDEQEVEKQENEEEGYSYYKTAFSIYAVIDGEEYSFKGRYDIGSEGKSLLEHIREYYDYSLSSDCMYRQYWEQDGVLDEKIEQITKYSENFLPYLEEHTGLTPAEQKQLDELGLEVVAEEE